MNISRKMTLVLACLVLIVALSMATSAWDDYDYDDYGDATAAWTLFGLGAMVCLVIPIVWFIIWLLVGIWVYKDAEKRGKSGVLWLIIVLLLGLLGIIIWLVVRPPIGGGKPAAASDRKCPNCGRAIPMDARTCPYCGKNFEQA